MLHYAFKHPFQKDTETVEQFAPDLLEIAKGPFYIHIKKQ